MKNITKALCLAIIASIMALAFSGCNTQKGKTEAEDPNSIPKNSYEINWYFMGEPQSDNASVEMKINEYLKDKINATVKLNRLPSSQYSQKMTAMIAAGEYYDISFTADWMLSYKSTASNGAWLALDEYLDKYLPETKAVITDDIFNNARVDGKIYGIPAMKEMATQVGFAYRKDIAEKHNINMDEVKTIEQLEEVLKLVQSKEPDLVYPIDWISNDKKPNQLARFVNITSGVGFEMPDPKVDIYSDKIVHSAFSESVIKTFGDARRFFEEGLVKKDVLTAKDFDQRLKSGKVFAYIEALKPGKAQEISRSFSFPLEQVAVSPIRMDINAGTGSMMAVSAKSKNPIRALRFLELVNTDKYLNNLVVYGVEGKHYNKIDENFVDVIPNSGYTLSESQWMMGNVFLNYLTKGEDPEKIEKLQEFNKKAVKHNFYGFVFNPKPVQQQIAAVAVVEKEFGPQVSCGAMDYIPLLKQYQEKLKAAGVQSIIDEMQKQYDEFSASKK